MIKKHYASKTTDAACSMAYCNDCIMNYIRMGHPHKSLWT